MSEPTTAAGRARRWAVFEDEDHVFRAVTEAEGDDISWPEMGEDDVERMVDEHNAAIVEARAAALDEARAAVEHSGLVPESLAGQIALAAIDALIAEVADKP